MATSPATAPEAAPREVGCPLDQQPAQHGRGRSTHGVDQDQPCLLGGGRSTDVEAEPAKPQQGRAEHDQGEVVRALARVLPESLSRADQQDQDQRRHAGVDVHHQPAREVDRLAEAGADRPIGAQQAPAPDHERQRRVDQGGPHRHEQQPGAEAHAVCHGSGDQRDRDDRERAGERDAQQVARADQVLQPRRLQRAARQASQDGLATGDRPPPQDPHRDHQTQGGEGHHHHVQHALGTGHAPVEQGQSRRHQQHHGAGDHGPHIDRAQRRLVHRQSLLASRALSGAAHESSEVMSHRRRAVVSGV